MLKLKYIKRKLNQKSAGKEAGKKDVSRYQTKKNRK